MKNLRHKTYGPLQLPYTFDISIEPILGFYGEFEFLSNFFPYPVLTQGGILPSSEHAYMIEKDSDPAYKKKIREAKTPGRAKRIGNTANLPADWDEVRRFPAMHGALKCKFVDREMATRIIRTGYRYLEETNNHGDTFWGRYQGRGKNHLGRQLMVIRQMLFNQELLIRN